MKIAVIGSRTFKDYTLLKKILDEENIDMIVTGGAKGADSLSQHYAKLNGLTVLIFYPNWKEFGKAAGFVRNHKIVEQADKVIAFWDGVSKGTKSSLDIALKQNKPIRIVDFK